VVICSMLHPLVFFQSRMLKVPKLKSFLMALMLRVLMSCSTFSFSWSPANDWQLMVGETGLSMDIFWVVSMLQYRSSG